MVRWKKTLTTVAVASTVGGLLTGFASVDAVNPVGTVAEAQLAIDGVRETDSSLLLTAVSESAVGEVPLGDGSVTLPSDLAEGVLLQDPTGATISITAPGAEYAAEAVEADGGLVVYPGRNYSNSLLVGDGAVQMLTTIENPSSPTEYAYDVELDSGQTLQLVGDGAAVVNADGSIALAVANAWAKDANGTDINTRYKVDGSKLVQVVEHDTPGVAYPVVADPIWLAPWVVRCLMGIGLNSTQIANIASRGSLGSIAAAFGWAAVRCIMGR
jgi:hypothetical protein